MNDKKISEQLISCWLLHYCQDKYHCIQYFMWSREEYLFRYILAKWAEWVKESPDFEQLQILGESGTDIDSRLIQQKLFKVADPYNSAKLMLSTAKRVYNGELREDMKRFLMDRGVSNVTFVDAIPDLSDSLDSWIDFKQTGLDSASNGTGTNISEKPLDNSAKTGTISLQGTSEDGGPGSGNFGHKGVPGQVGGSASGQGSKYSQEDYEKALVGLKTSDGKEIKGISTHAVSRYKGRDVYPSSIARALEKAKPTPGNKPGRTVYEHRATRVVVADNTGTVITVVYLGKENK